MRKMVVFDDDPHLEEYSSGYIHMKHTILTLTQPWKQHFSEHFTLNLENTFPFNSKSE